MHRMAHTRRVSFDHLYLLITFVITNLIIKAVMYVRVCAYIHVQIRSAGYLDICTYKVIAAIFLWLQLYNQFR